MNHNNTHMYIYNSNSLTQKITSNHVWERKTIREIAREPDSSADKPNRHEHELPACILLGQTSVGESDVSRLPWRLSPNCTQQETLTTIRGPNECTIGEYD